MAIGFIELAAMFFAYIGAVVIIYGGIIAATKILRLEIRKTPGLSYDDTRIDFTHKIVFGLDFLIAGDILKTIVAPTQEEIILLGAIVGIRTVLGYFLGKEVGGFEK
ncbi:MAG: DUF1622 domain-containing protein [Candidatus Hydrothermarchaeales archaeon]